MGTDESDLMRSPQPDGCRDFLHPSVAQFTMSCLLMTWVLLSYLPQYARIVTRRSAEGVSTLYVLLGSLSGVCAAGNIAVLPSSEDGFTCCGHVTRFACIGALVGLGQVGVGVACFWGVLFLYVYYSTSATTAVEPHDVASPSLLPTSRRARHAWLVLLSASAFALAVLLVSVVVVSQQPQCRLAWAECLGVAVAVLACVQWVPQAVTTWKLGRLGSLSLASVGMSAPYTWLFGINMLLRVGPGGWSAWVVYVLVGTLQLVIIAMGVSFKITGETHAPDEMRRPRSTPYHFVEGCDLDKAFGRWTRRSSAVSSSFHVAPDERRPLLSSGTGYSVPDRTRGDSGLR